MVTGKRRWYISGCYLVPGNDTMIQDVEAAMVERQRGAELIVTGEFKVDLEKTGVRGLDENIAAVVVTAGLEDMAGYLFPLRRV